MSAPSRFPSPTKGTNVPESTSATAPTSRTTTQGRFQARLTGKAGISARSTADHPPRSTAHSSVENSTINDAPRRMVSTHARSRSTANARNPPDSKVSPKDPGGRSLHSGSHLRTLSTSTYTRSTTTYRNPAESSTKLSGLLPTSQANPRALNDATLQKPSFNTYKQTFSPKKPKQGIPPSSTTVPTNNPVAVQASLQPSRLYDETLQLSVSHQYSTAALRHFADSIRTSLEAGRADLQTQIRHVASLEKDRQGRRNVEGVREWIDQGVREESAEFDKLSLLAACVQELFAISKREGPFLVAMEEFNQWQRNAATAKSRRAKGEDIEGCFTIPLGRKWATTMSSVQGRVEACTDTIKTLGAVTESSSIGSMISGLLVLAEQFTQEVKMCMDLEGLILQQEQDWVESSLTHALSAVKPKASQGERVVARRGLWEYGWSEKNP